MPTARVLPWLLRASWVVLPVVAGPAFAAALDGRSSAVTSTASVAMWAAWAVVACASLVLHPIALTVVRMLTPAAATAAVITPFAGAPGADATAAIASTFVGALVAFLPDVGVVFVNGPAYPNERRFPLRPPGPLVVGPLLLAWLLAVGLPAVGLLLLAADRTVVGTIATVSGAVAAIVLSRSMYSLAKRWIVFVPAGVVVHDPLTLADPVLLRRRDVTAFRAAPATTDALDLTARAFGLAIEIVAREAATLALVKPGSRVPALEKASKLLVTPTRPGAVLAEARARRFD